MGDADSCCAVGKGHRTVSSGQPGADSYPGETFFESPPPSPAGSRDSSVGIGTRYRLDGPVIESRWGARFSAPVQTGSEAHPASYTMGTGFFPGVKRSGGDVEHPIPSSAEVKERVGIYLYSPSGLS